MAKWQAPKEFFKDELGSTNNSAVFENKFDATMDYFLMLAQQHAGICNVDYIKTNFVMFRHIEESTLQRRCQTLLGCSSVTDMQKMDCDPFKVQAYYRARKAAIKRQHEAKHTTGRLPALHTTELITKDGRVLNSWPTDELGKYHRRLFYWHNFRGPSRE